LIRCSRSPVNSAKIGPVDVEIIGLKGIVKINKKQQQSISLSGLVLRVYVEAGRAKNDKKSDSTRFNNTRRLHRKLEAVGLASSRKKYLVSVRQRDKIILLSEIKLAVCGQKRADNFIRSRLFTINRHSICQNDAIIQRHASAQV